MRSRGLILCLIILTLLTTCLAAAAKLRATPKYDRIQVGQPVDLKLKIGGGAFAGTGAVAVSFRHETDEGRIHLDVRSEGSGQPFIVTQKRLERRGPLERLAWLAGWR